jgi:uncharacterized Zn-finger protein
MANGPGPQENPLRRYSSFQNISSSLKSPNSAMSFELNHFNFTQLYPDSEASVMHADYLYSDLDTKNFLPGMLPTSDEFGMLPASNEFEMELLATEVHDASSELRMLEGTASDFNFFPDIAQEGWSFFPDALRASSCPPLTFSAEPTNDRKVLNTTVGRKIYSCSICPKTFKKKYGLDSHMNTHSNVRPYKCSTCPDSFKRANDMRRHVKVCVKKLARRGSAY